MWCKAVAQYLSDQFILDVYEKMYEHQFDLKSFFNWLTEKPEYHANSVEKIVMAINELDKLISSSGASSNKVNLLQEGIVFIMMLFVKLSAEKQHHDDKILDPKYLEIQKSIEVTFDNTITKLFQDLVNKLSQGKSVSRGPATTAVYQKLAAFLYGVDPKTKNFYTTASLANQKNIINRKLIQRQYELLDKKNLHNEFLFCIVLAIALFFLLISFFISSNITIKTAIMTILLTAIFFFGSNYISIYRRVRKNQLRFFENQSIPEMIDMAKEAGPDKKELSLDSRDTIRYSMENDKLATALSVRRKFLSDITTEISTQCFAETDSRPAGLRLVFLNPNHSLGLIKESIEKLSALLTVVTGPFFRTSKKQIETEYNPDDINCGICRQDKDIKDFLILDCGHKFCQECIVEYFLVNLNSPSLPPRQTFELLCFICRKKIEILHNNLTLPELEDSIRDLFQEMSTQSPAERILRKMSVITHLNFILNTLPPPSK